MSGKASALVTFLLIGVSWTIATPECPIVLGCTADSAAQCDHGPGNECDVTMPTEVCHWPASTTGCQRSIGVPDCDCAPRMLQGHYNGNHPIEGEYEQLPDCPIIRGCSYAALDHDQMIGEYKLCRAGDGSQCDTSDPTHLEECHWPAIWTNTCKQVGMTPDCYCGNI